MSQASPIIAIDFGALLEQVEQHAYQGTRRALIESANQASTDYWLGSAEAAKLLGYPTIAAFKQARSRNPKLAALGIKHGKLWRYRRADLDGYMLAHPRAGRRGRC